MVREAWGTEGLVREAWRKKKKELELEIREISTSACCASSAAAGHGISGPGVEINSY